MLRRNFLRAIAAVALGAAAVTSLTACAPATVDMATVDQVIDVRTADEYAAGHLEGAVNIDVEAGNFDAAIAQLDKDKTYLVYCRSGRRSAIAKENMHDAGFHNVIDAGGLDAAANTTGLAIVQ